MKRVQVREAKAEFSALVAAAERGEPITITKYGEPAAILVPVEDAEKTLSQASEIRQGIAKLERAGDISDRAKAKGSSPGSADILHAATAEVYWLAIAARNLRHFKPLNAPALTLGHRIRMSDAHWLGGEKR